MFVRKSQPETQASAEGGPAAGLVRVAMTVNGKTVSADVEPRTLLVHYLREHLRLTGTHVGCDTSQCGACVVHLDGKAVKSCTALAASCEGANVTTIEGLAQGAQLHPMQEAFRPRRTPPAWCRTSRPCHPDARRRRRTGWYRNPRACP